MSKEFTDWWIGGGFQQWHEGLDSEGGTLAALEMVFDSGMKAAKHPEPSRQDQKVSMIPGPYGYTDEYKGGLK